MKEEIKFSDFEKLDIRIGTVIKAEVPEWSHWVMRLTVDIAAPDGAGLKTVFAGIMKTHKPEDLEGKQFPFVVNLKPKKMGPKGDFSEGMMLMATPQATQAGGQAIVKDDEETAPVLFALEAKVANGSRVG